MAPETSQFESSEMLATFLVSTGLPAEAWRMCSVANSASGQQQGFVAERAGQTALVAFSGGVQAVGAYSEGDLVEMEGGGEGIFEAFGSGVEGEEAVMVHGGLLRLFLCFHGSDCFRQKLLELLNDCKSIIFTGHGLGGALASLSVLWLLSNLQKVSPSLPVFCITFGSPMLGNQALSRAILQERWGGNFCHIVAQYDIIPRLLFVPASQFIPPLFAMFQFMQSRVTSPNSSQLAFRSCSGEKDAFSELLACVEARLKLGDNQEEQSYWPFGSYVFCSKKGEICLDNSRAIVMFLHSTMAGCSVDLCIEDHLKYEDYVGGIFRQCLQKMRFEDGFHSESNNEAGIGLALQSSGISSQAPIYGKAMNCLLQARQLGWRRNINNAKMAVSLSRITPFRAELEWYKDYCDESPEQLGYYDSFKRRGASKREFKVKMNMRKLGCFWDDLLDKLQKNQLTPDFYNLPKYVNASHSYELLVEPLEIADYYRSGMHKKKGHYMDCGRNKRFKIFDKWWGDRKVGDEEGKPRSKYAGLTQDSCFWARVEEALDFIVQAMAETDCRRRLQLLDKIERFDKYANQLIDRMEVSIDVLAKNSSYNLFREAWKGLKSQHHCPGFRDGMVQ